MKLCMIGSRGHSNYVFDSLAESGVTLSAVSSGCADSPERLLSMAAEKGLQPECCDADYCAMLDRIKPDFVSIDGPFDRHAEMCVAALERRINVFCEKPIALTLPDLEAIERAWRAAGGAKIVSMVGLRYDDAFYFARRLVESGAIGKVKMIFAQKSYRLGTRSDYFRSRATYGGTISWVGSHALDWIMNFSQSDFARVYAAQSATDNRDHGELEVCAQCQFVMRNGVLAQAGIDYLRPESAPTHGDDRVRIGGTDGVIEVRDGQIMLIDKNGSRIIEPPPADRHLFSDFVFDVTGQRRGLVDSRQTFALTRACLLAQQSADCGREVLFPSDNDADAVAAADLTVKP